MVYLGEVMYVTQQGAGQFRVVRAAAIAIRTDLYDAV
jgi:hypothetical protein